MAPGRLGELLGAAGAEPGAPPSRTTRVAGDSSYSESNSTGYGRDEAGSRRPRQAAGAAVAGRGNLVRQAVTLLVHHPAAATAVSAQQIEDVAQIDRPGIALLAELLSQLREDPPPNTAAVLERWRGRPEYGSLAKLAQAVCIAPDAAGATAELRSALNRLITEESPVRRLDELMAKARDASLDDAEKQELQTLLRRGRPAAATAAPDQT
jgi:hypothetical protein